MRGNPNTDDMKLDFTAKVYDAKSGTYKPVYILPDATSEVRGGTYLSDATDGTDGTGDTTIRDATSGVTAASPKAVKLVQDNANNKLDKVTSTAQTVTSATTFTGKVTGTSGFVGNLTGDVAGNATSADKATKLANSRTISVSVGNSGDIATGSATFDGTTNASISISSIPLSAIPQGALERLVHVTDQAARFALTTDNVQLGDTVMQDDTQVMYVVVDTDALASEKGYQEYKAGTAVNAQHANAADEAAVATRLSTSAGAANKPIFFSDGMPQEGTYELNKSVPSDAVFTDTTYDTMVGATTSADGEGGLVPTPSKGEATRYLRSDGTWVTPPDTTYDVMKGATASAAGSGGLVPTPPAGSNLLFLRGDGSWAEGGKVTSVNGDIGDVVVTASKITAMGASYDDKYFGLATPDLEDTEFIRTSKSGLLPYASDGDNGSSSIGTESWPFSTAYIKTINGTSFTGNAATATAAESAVEAEHATSADTAASATTASSATTATTASKLNNTVQITGSVGSNATTLNTTSAVSISTWLNDDSVTTSKISAKSVTNAKLADDVGTVYVGSTEPTEEHVKLWIKT